MAPEPADIRRIEERAAGVGIALVPQLVTSALPAGVTALRLRDEQAPCRRVVAIIDARRQSSELTRMFIRLAKPEVTVRAGMAGRRR
jgi:hypothetical protein